MSFFGTKRVLEKFFEFMKSEDMVESVMNLILKV